MCGILGAYDVGAVDDRRLAAMSEAIAHRGPDAVGAWSGPGDPPRVRLGHRRLSIIDLSDAANQPFVKDGLALVFCGEIYNFRELPGQAGRRRHRLPHRLRHRGAAGGLAPLGPGQPPPPARHVRLRAVRRASGHPHPGP